MSEVKQSGTLYIFSAPSGAGKTSLIKDLLEQFTDIFLSISHTTRKPRIAEVDGKDYYFVSESTFLDMVETHQFIEHAKVFDNYYGTSASHIQEDLDKGTDVILEIDWQGAEQVKQRFQYSKSIFILPPSKEELFQRLSNRGQDSSEVIHHRMEQAVAEISHYKQYDYIVVNDNFDIALSEIIAIVTAQRLTQDKQLLKLDKLIKNLLA